MKKMQDIVLIKGEKIPIRIRSYRNTKKIRIFFHEDLLCVSKPTRYSNRRLEKLILENEDLIFKQYQAARGKEKENRKQWKTGEKILFQGEEYEIIRVEKMNQKRITIEVSTEEKKILVIVPAEKETPKEKIDQKMVQLFRNQTEEILASRLPFWSEQTGLIYQTVRISDTKSKYGSCMPQRKALQFSARLSMLSKDEVDAVIVHELCHLQHANHSKDFYQLIQEYMPNYLEINQLLKKNGKKIIF